MEIQTIDVAYTVGGATFSVSTSEGTNDSRTQQVMTVTEHDLCYVISILI